MAYVSYVSRTDTSITVRLAGLDTSYNGNIRTVNWKAGTSSYSMRSYGTTTLSNQISQSSTFTFYSLSSGTKYYICATVSANGWAQSYDFETELWTEDPPTPPSIDSFSVSQAKIGSNSATCSWRASNLSGASYKIEAASSTGQYWQKASGTAYSSGSATITLDNFGTYTVRITITNSDGTYDTEYTSVTMQSIDKWDWNKSNGRASAAQTQAAYRAITSNGDTTSFPYMVWNDLVDKTLSVRSAAGFSWNNKYASYGSTQMSSSDKTLYAWKFNSLRYNVYEAWSPVSSGDTVYGYYFTQIANQINTWIDNL